VADLVLVRPVNSSLIEGILTLAVCASGLLVVFHKPLGLSDDWEWCFLVLLWVFLIPLFLLRKRRRAARLAAGLPAAEKPFTKRRFWLLLLLIIAMSLSDPWWLPYTGVVLPTSTRVVASIIGCALAVLALVLSWRYWNKRV
jgi:hypothetical protein